MECFMRPSVCVCFLASYSVTSRWFPSSLSRWFPSSLSLLSLQATMTVLMKPQRQLKSILATSRNIPELSNFFFQLTYMLGFAWMYDRWNKEAKLPKQDNLTSWKHCTHSHIKLLLKQKSGRGFECTLDDNGNYCLRTGRYRVANVVISRLLHNLMSL